MPMRESVIVWGPQGSGKTKNAEAIKEHFVLDMIVESPDFDQWMFSHGTLYLTNEPVPAFVTIPSYHINDIKALLGEKFK